MSRGRDLVFSRTDLRVVKTVDGEDLREDLDEGAVQLRIDKFGLTANNVTYAVYGDSIGYWGFFPADDGWGRVPVWGFATVSRSAHPGIREGERFYGFLPMSTHLTVIAQPNGGGMKDVSPHRLALPKAYNQYFSTEKDPVHDRDHEDEQMILRPLFVTSFLAADYLSQRDLAGARAIAISSASSKTAYGIAALLIGTGIEVVGLTSSRNRGFVEGLGCYDRVVTYDTLGDIPSAPTAYVDVAGSPSLRAGLRSVLGDNLVYSVALGDTHWDEKSESGDMTSEQEFFFAPNWLSKRTTDWGMQGYVERLADAWQSFVPKLAGWMQIRHGEGAGAITEVWSELLDGRTDPATGHVMRL